MKNLIALFITAAPNIKSWLFSDGKFKPLRALIIALFFVLILLSVHFFGFEATERNIDLLDEISDVIGYA